tara:strand:- start:1084 stop:1197 length:114 start_codon:yes stop_codon:yes gene_type:complete
MVQQRREMGAFGELYFPSKSSGRRDAAQSLRKTRKRG